MSWKEMQERQSAREKEMRRINDIYRRVHDAFWGRNQFSTKPTEEKDDRNQRSS